MRLADIHETALRILEIDRVGHIRLESVLTRELLLHAAITGDLQLKHGLLSAFEGRQAFTASLMSVPTRVSNELLLPAEVPGRVSTVKLTNCLTSPVVPSLFLHSFIDLPSLPL